jgi:hypothetical protein
MSLINGIIQPQAFEVIRDQLGAILAVEVFNQSVLNGNDENLNAKIWIERFIPFDKTEFPSISVALMKGVYSGQTVQQADGTYSYNIDVFASAKSKNGEKGDSMAMVRLHRLLGICRSILDDPKYKTLGFSKPFIMSKHIGELHIAEPGHGDALSSVMGRLIINVKAPENYELISAAMLSMNTTIVKLEETEKGYTYIYPQLP